MNSPKVSVIVPVYNTEKYLNKCLDSLVNQTLQELEIVIINDGSKDSSPDVIQAYMDKYPDKFVYRTQENSGQAVARNKALGLCTGTYVGFLDSDDFVKEDMFQRMYEKAVEEDADYVAGTETTVILSTSAGVEIYRTSASAVPLALDITGIKGAEDGVITFVYAVTLPGSTTTNEAGEIITIPGGTEERTISRAVRFAKE